MFLKAKNNLFGSMASRLALLYAFLFGMLSICAFAIIYFSLSSNLSHMTNVELMDDTVEFENIYHSHGLDALKDEFNREAGANGQRRVVFKLFSNDGKLVASSNLKAWLSINAYGKKYISKPVSGAVFGTVALHDVRDSVRIVTRRIDDGHVIQVGKALGFEERLLEHFILVFTVILVVMLISGTIMGYFMVVRAMKGVERIADTAVGVSGGNLSRRVSLGNEGREIDDLAMAFNEMLGRIDSLVTDLKDVTDNLAHDIRGPITRIRGFAEKNLLDGDDNCRDIAATVIEESDRLIGMINNILDIARTDSGVEKFPIQPVELNGIISEACDLFKPVAEDVGIIIEADVPSDSIIIYGNESRLQRAISNILDNAIKYSDGGGIKISLAVDGDKARLSISDNGIGIKKEDIDHIFDRFFRADASRSTSGSGLGLSLAFAIARAHGGNIEVKSEFGHGSTFTLVLPLFPKLDG